MTGTRMAITGLCVGALTLGAWAQQQPPTEEGVRGLKDIRAPEGPAVEAEIRTEERDPALRGEVQVQPDARPLQPLAATGPFHLYRASELVGQSVRNLQDERIGRVHELAIDMDRAQTAYVVLSYRGEYFAVPFGTMQVRLEEDDDVDQIVMNIDRERLREADGFDRANWPDMADTRWGRDIYAHYDQPIYWETELDRPILRGEPVAPRREDDSEKLLREERRIERFEADDDEGLLERRRVEARLDDDKGDEVLLERHEARIHRGQVRRAEEHIIGRRVEDRLGERIGDVEDLLIDANTGRVAFAVVKLSHEELFESRELAAVPIESFSYRADDRDRLTLILHEDEGRVRENTFERGDWPNLRDEQWAMSVYQHYGQTPYWRRG